ESQPHLRSRSVVDHESLSIGAVVERTGVAHSALRFYEAEGLIESSRADSGHRRYHRDVIRRSSFIRVAQQVGLTLDGLRPALCHPPLGDDEVRAVLRSTNHPIRWRLTVLAHDRPRLMADTAGTLASEGLPVHSVSATGWPAVGTAMHSMVVTVPRRRRWQRP